jgi:hypothetical protein
MQRVFSGPDAVPKHFNPGRSKPPTPVHSRAFTQILLPATDCHVSFSTSEQEGQVARKTLLKQ